MYAHTHTLFVWLFSQEKQITSGATAPMYQKCDLRTFDLTSLGTKFDVVLLQPPLEEYQRRASGVAFSWTPWEWEEIMALKVEEVAAQRSFVFLWCGSGEGEGGWVSRV